MKRIGMVIAGAALAAAGMGQPGAPVQPSAPAQPSAAAPALGPHTAYKPPRTAWGDPDLQGMWPLDSVGQTPFQRPEKFGTRTFLTDAEYADAQKKATEALAGADKEERGNKLGAGHWFERGNALRQTSLITEPANGRVPPMTAEGQKRAAAMKSSWSEKTFDSIDDFNSLDRCITRGLPASMVPFPYNNGVQLFQAPGYVVINMELIHETRIVPLDGRPAPTGTTRWLGESRGHWEGNSLVIETSNFNGETPMVIVGPSNRPVPTSRQLHVRERLTPTGPDGIYYEAWISDPEVLTAPWKMEFPWTRRSDYKPFEYACHEGNTLIRGYVRATSPRFAAYRQAHGGK